MSPAAVPKDEREAALMKLLRAKYTGLADCSEGQLKHIINAILRAAKKVRDERKK